MGLLESGNARSARHAKLRFYGYSAASLGAAVAAVGASAASALGGMALAAVLALALSFGLLAHVSRVEYRLLRLVESLRATAGT